MIPAYQASHFSAFFFVTFLILGLYLLLNFTLAVVYSHYRYEFTKEKKMKFAGLRFSTQLYLILLKFVENILNLI